MRPMKLDQMTAAVYVRTGEGDFGSMTVEEQIRGCRDFLNRKGLKLKKDLIFSDEGFPGSTLKRPALARLREAVDDGTVSVVIVYRLDRLSTSLIDCVSLVRREWDDKCYLVSVSEDFHTGGPSGVRIFDILQRFLDADGAAMDAMQVLDSLQAAKATSAASRRRF